jgi:rhodanese-related sulfurtransferase
MTEIREVDAPAGAALVDDGAVLLDVRERFEWDGGHAPAAVWIPLGELPDRVAEVPRDRQVVVVCRSGGRSLRAAGFLAQSGVDAVNLSGGMHAWKAAGLPMHSETAGEPDVL